jgi:hypothetical protein
VGYRLRKVFELRHLSAYLIGLAFSRMPILRGSGEARWFPQVLAKHVPWMKKTAWEK